MTLVLLVTSTLCHTYKQLNNTPFVYYSINTYTLRSHLYIILYYYHHSPRTIEIRISFRSHRIPLPPCRIENVNVRAQVPLLYETTHHLLVHDTHSAHMIPQLQLDPNLEKEAETKGDPLRHLLIPVLRLHHSHHSTVD